MTHVDDSVTPRPDGSVIWFHVPHDVGLGSVVHLIDRMVRQDVAANFVVTTATQVTLMGPGHPAEGVCHHVTQSFERRSALTEFLNVWRPNVAVWMRGSLNSSHVADISARDIPLYLVDASTQGLQEFRGLLAAWRAKGMMRRFDRCLASDDEAAQRLKALGTQPWRIEVTGPLEEGTAALPHDEEDRRDLAEALATRPVWLAVHVPEDEIGVVLEAHKDAMRRSHRFLLVLRPTPDQDAAQIVSRVRDAGFAVAVRSEVYVPSEDDQVLIADLPEERGLWYRVAPITYMGGTFANTAPHNPFEPAALGSAIVHGPNIIRHRRNFDRLSDANGTVAIHAPGHLGAALSDLNFPDRAARLAHAAWDVSSSGAEVTDRVVGLLQDALPNRGA